MFYKLNKHILLPLYRIDTDFCIYMHIENEPYLEALFNITDTVDYNPTKEKAHLIIRLIFRRLQEKIKEFT